MALDAPSRQLKEGVTDQWTHPLLEIRCRIKKSVLLCEMAGNTMENKGNELKWLKLF